MLCACLSISAVLGQTNADRGAVTEYEVKAAFLLNFVKFVEWPSLEETSARAPFSICVLGDDPFGTTLDQIIEGQTINGRPLVVKRLKKWRPPCDVLFVSNSERGIASVLNQVGPGVLTVGESPDFLRDGGMMNFVVQDRRVRFDVNRGAAERASLRISSRLLAVARSVVK